MARSESLFRLISSLSKSEKRYFKLFASVQGKNKKYVLLFDAIDKQNEYDEEQLKAHFREEAFVRQFSVAKNYLYSLVMKSLRQYHSGSSAAFQLYEMLHDTEILARRGLTEEAGRVAEKAIHLARKHEKFSLHLEALGWHKASRTNHGMIQESAAERDQVIRKLDNFSSYVLLMDRASRIVQDIGIRNKEAVIEIEQLMRDPLLQGEASALSFRSLLYYHWIYATCYFGMNSYHEALRSVQEMITLIESQPDALPEFIDIYVSALNNALVLYYRSGNMKGFQESVERLRTRGKQTLELRSARRNDAESRIFQAVYIHLLAMYNSLGQYTEAKDIIPEVESGMKRYGRFIDEASQAIFLNNLTLHAFGLKEYRQALGYNNRVIMKQPHSVGLQLFTSAKLVNIVLHYELGHTSLLKSFVASTRKLLESWDRLFVFEATFLDFFDKLLRLRSSSAKAEAFISLRERFVELQQNPLEHDPFRSFGYLEWVESKIGGDLNTGFPQEPSVHIT